MPNEPLGHVDSWSVSPSKPVDMIKRLDSFLRAYSAGDQRLEYSTAEVLAMTIKRLDAMVDWFKVNTQMQSNTVLFENLDTYARHRDWLTGVCGDSVPVPQF